MAEVETIKKIIEKNELAKPPKVGQVVKGKVVAFGRSSVFLDLGPFGSGVIYGKEFSELKKSLKKLKIGEEIFAKIVDLDNEDGYVELSLKGAQKEMNFEVLKEKMQKREEIEVEIFGVNRGGLLTKILDLPAFIPISQLSPEFYEKLKNKKPKEILKQLQKFVGQKMKVKILSISGQGEIILSEKMVLSEKKKDFLKNYQPGQVVEGTVSAVTDFGVFLEIEPGLEGLIEEPLPEVKKGDHLKARVKEIAEGKIYLSKL